MVYLYYSQERKRDGEMKTTIYVLSKSSLEYDAEEKILVVTSKISTLLDSLHKNWTNEDYIFSIEIWTELPNESSNKTCGLFCYSINKEFSDVATWERNFGEANTALEYILTK